jgi:thioesterase domain-containing protein/acyl carrier protein
MENYRQLLKTLSEQQRVELYRELQQRLGQGSSPVRELLVLFETDEGTDPTSAMRELAELELAEYERPTRYLPVNRLPLNPQGKLDRAALAALVPDENSETAVATLPGVEQSKLQAVSEAFAQSLARARVGADDNFFELGGHSLLLVDCILGIEKKTGVRLSTDVFLQNPTPRALAAELESKTRPASAYVYPVAEAAGGLPVFIFSASRLAYALKQRPKPWRLFGVQLRWLDDKHQLIPYRDLQDLARRICAELSPVVSDKPYVIAGSSFAGMLAFEVACQMDKAGMAPSLTVLIDPSPFAGLRTWLQNDLEADTNIGYARHLLLAKWLLINNPLRMRFWQRIKQRFVTRNEATTRVDGEPVRATSAIQASSFNDDRTFALWRNYRASSYGGRLALMTTRERVWQVEQNWRPYLPAGTAPILLDTTHKQILREPFMSSDVVPLLESAIEQAFEV